MKMIEELQLFFSYEFVIRAVITGAVISLCAALLGTSLVLKRYSMIGDGLSHVGFGTLAVATAMNVTQMWVSLPVVIVAAFLLLRISENGKSGGDSAIAVISTVSLALGYIMMYKHGTNIDISNYMFGNIFTITKMESIIGITLAVVVGLMFILFYHKIFAVTFDETFSKAVGVKAGVYNGIIAVLTAVVVVIGMKMMGTLLISALIIFPSLISMKLCKSFKGVVITAAIISVICFMIGIMCAHLCDIPAGSTIVVVNTVLLLLASVYNYVRKRIC